MNVKKLICKALLIACLIAVSLVGVALAINPSLYALIGIIVFGVFSGVLTTLVIGEEENGR